MDTQNTKVEDRKEVSEKMETCDDQNNQEVPEMEKSPTSPAKATKNDQEQPEEQPEVQTNSQAATEQSKTTEEVMISEDTATEEAAIVEVPGTEEATIVEEPRTEEATTVEVPRAVDPAPETDMSTAVESHAADVAAPLTADAGTTGEQAAESNTAVSSLTLLAQYDTSESDDDSVVEVPLANNTDYRQGITIINSDCEEEADKSSSDSDDEYMKRMRKAIDKQYAQSDDDDDDDEFGTSKSKTDSPNKRREPPKVKGEMLIDDLPPIEDLHITVPEEECLQLGRVHSIVDQLVLVNVLPNSVLLDLETVLFLEKGKKVLGEIFDVLGQVADPLYCVRFNSNKQIQEKAIAVGDLVYVAPKTQYTQLVILGNLTKIRGSDASWENDVEPPPRFVDYSDDEEERQARSKLRNKDRADTEQDGPRKVARQRTERTNADAHGETSARSPQHSRRGNQRRDFNRGGYNQQQGGHRQFGNNPQGYANPGSWHSNYYGSAVGTNYRMPPPYQQQMYPTPSTFQSPYGQMPAPMPPQSHTSSDAPMYVLNPYAVMRSSMLSAQPGSEQPPPPPPYRNAPR